MPGWHSQAAFLADQYCAGFDTSAKRVSDEDYLHGWLGRGLGTSDRCLYVVSHPLWDITSSSKGLLASKIMSWAQSLDASDIRFLDTFNLSRRMAWVRGALHSFPSLPIGLGVAPSDTGSEQSWMVQLASLDVGASATYFDRHWTRISAQSAWVASPGSWIAQIEGQQLFEVIIRVFPGAGVKIHAVGKDGFLQRDSFERLAVIARESTKDAEA